MAECCFAGQPGQDSLDIGIGLIVARQQGFGCLGALPFLLVESIGQLPDSLPLFFQSDAPCVQGSPRGFQLRFGSITTSQLLARLAAAAAALGIELVDVVIMTGQVAGIA